MRIIFFEMRFYEIAGQARNDVVCEARNDKKKNCAKKWKRLLLSLNIITTFCFFIAQSQ